MAILKLMVNGLVVKNESKDESLRSALHGIMTTKNVDSVTVKNALDILGGTQWADGFAKNGKYDDKVEIYEDSTLKARYTRQNLAQRIRIAVTVKDWSGEIFTEKSAKKSDGEIPQVITSDF